MSPCGNVIWAFSIAAAEDQIRVNPGIPFLLNTTPQKDLAYFDWACWAKRTHKLRTAAPGTLVNSTTNPL
jgi:hypothetical protein